MATTPDNDNSASLIPLSAVPTGMIEEVLDRAFGSERHARTAYRIRAGMDWLPALSFAALDADEMLVGTIQCWPVSLLDPEGRALPLIMVGPVAVLPERQGEGFGQGLMAAMLDSESRLAADGQMPFAQMLIGDADYYGRWGFSAAMTGGWRCPGPYEADRLLARGPALSAMSPEGMLGPWSDPSPPGGTKRKPRNAEQAKQPDV
ncbi:MAG: N-acetyltransferase [Erythrobacter sp.]